MAWNQAQLIDQLQTRYAAIVAELSVLNASGPGGIPNATGSGMVDHVGYKDGLYRELKTIREQLAELDGSFELHSEV